MLKWIEYVYISTSLCVTVPFLFAFVELLVVLVSLNCCGMRGTVRMCEIARLGDL